MHVTGAPALLIIVPLLIGYAICLAGGVWLGLYLVAWIIDRIAQKYELVYEFYLFLLHKRRKREVPPQSQ
jgi:hypothetical protein